MKLTALKIVYDGGAVQVFSAETVHVTLTTLIKHHVVALDSVSLDPLTLGMPQRYASKNLELVPLHLKGLPNRLVGRPGLIVGCNIPTILDFLLKNWDPKGNSELDAMIRAAMIGRRSKDTRLRDLEDALCMEIHDEIDLFEGPRRRSKKRLRFVWTAEAFRSSFTALVTGGEKVYLPQYQAEWSCRRTWPFTAIVERTQTVHGHNVPRWDVFTMFSSARLDCHAHGFWDGRWFHSPWNRLDCRVIEFFDKQGTFVNIGEGDLLASENLQARFLIRVPKRDAPTQLNDDVPSALKAIPGALMLDSRCPVSIPDDVHVVTDSGKAWSVLLRTMSGIFLPDTAPFAAPEAFKQLKGAWIVGGVPTGKVS